MIQVYTGTGKGKTTAAFGLAVRAAGAGFRVYIGQFLKRGSYSELKAIKQLPQITIEQYGTGGFIRKTPGKREIEAARKGLELASKAIRGKRFKVIILDEFNVALRLRLFSCAEALELIKLAPKNTELVLTGRDADKTILKCADLVSEIREIKHYYRKGQKARRGIEF